jgi:ketosteroid isomerase-like protein
MGSENGLDVFDAIDKAWASLDLETVKSYISEDAVMKFADGKVAVGGDQFVEMIQQEVEQWGKLNMFGQQITNFL